MTPKQKQLARIVALALILVVALLWKGQGFLSPWEGTVTQLVLPTEGNKGYVMLRDDQGRYFRIYFPREHIEELSVGDRLAKPRMSLRVKVVEKAPKSSEKETTSPIIR
ncbi:MAG: hypothetical protein N2Z21_00540 [Candidatus Sumerlaeaceae bacterium]|nr:hypothetical protein [Candidatus Sumerlaeaceae bacterium]